MYTYISYTYIGLHNTVREASYMSHTPSYIYLSICPSTNMYIYTCIYDIYIYTCIYQYIYIYVHMYTYISYMYINHACIYIIYVYTYM